MTRNIPKYDARTLESWRKIEEHLQEATERVKRQIAALSANEPEPFAHLPPCNVSPAALSPLELRLLVAVDGLLGALSRGDNDIDHAIAFAIRVSRMAHEQLNETLEKDT